jgi:hypothetical protein
MHTISGWDERLGLCAGRRDDRQIGPRKIQRYRARLAMSKPKRLKSDCFQPSTLRLPSCRTSNWPSKKYLAPGNRAAACFLEKSRNLGPRCCDLVRSELVSKSVLAELGANFGCEHRALRHLGRPTVNGRRLPSEQSGRRIGGFPLHLLRVQF